MTLDDILDIKDRFLRPHVRAEALGAWSLLVKTASPRRLSEARRLRSVMDLQFPSVALGATARGKGLAVAVRVVEPSSAAAKLVDRVRRESRGEVEVENVGRVRALPAAMPRALTDPPFRKRVRPLRAGFSVGHGRSTGTLGSFVVDGDDEVCILSNNHVLASSNAGRRGDPILQPGTADGGAEGARHHVGWLKRFVPLSTLAGNRVDAAIAVLRADVEHCPGDHVGQPLVGVRPGTALPGTPVWKVGRTTAVTFGRVRAFALDNLRVAYGAVEYEFDDQLEIVGTRGLFSRRGDSGSLVLDDQNGAVGLLFAGSQTGGPGGVGVTYVNPISAVLEALAVELQVAPADPGR